MLGNILSIDDFNKNVEAVKRGKELSKVKEEVQTKLDALDSKIKKLENLENKVVGEPLKNTPAVVEAPPPSKSKTLMYVGIVAGGIVVTYLLLKFSKKE